MGDATEQTSKSLHDTSVLSDKLAVQQHQEGIEREPRSLALLALVLLGGLRLLAADSFMLRQEEVLHLGVVGRERTKGTKTLLDNVERR